MSKGPDKLPAVWAGLHQKELKRLVKDGYMDSAEAKKLKLEFEFPFAASIGRRFRFDCVNLHSMTAVEIDGGIWKGGRHCRPAGFRSDREKDRLAQRFGFHVEHYCSDELTEKNVKEFIEVQRNRMVIEAAGGDRWVMMRFSESVFGKKN